MAIQGGALVACSGSSAMAGIRSTTTEGRRVRGAKADSPTPPHARTGPLEERKRLADRGKAEYVG